MTLNPYAKYLGDANPKEVIAATPQRVAKLLEGLDDSRLTQPPAPGKWSLRDILCHLADCEVAFGFRLRQVLAEPNHVIQPFDQDRWAGPYAHFDAGSALATFGAMRHWNTLLISSVPVDGFLKPVTHPERGAMTFGTIVETMGGHDLNHLAQIEALVR